VQGSENVNSSYVSDQERDSRNNGDSRNYGDSQPQPQPQYQHPQPATRAKKVYLFAHKVINNSATAANGREEVVQNGVQSNDSSPQGLFGGQIRRLQKLLAHTSRRIYIIDDFHYNIKAAQMLLQGADFEVVGEISAIQALKHIREVQAKEPYYELVLVDLNMPEMDGAECTQKIREMLDSGAIQPVKIVQCTAYSAEVDKQRCLKAGAHAFANKPISYEGLYQAIKSLYGVTQ
jgi:CheY-like chemotaxis protein